MSHNTVKAPMWCGWPHEEFATQIESVCRMGARCDAWRAFMTSSTLEKLRTIKGYFGWFNEHKAFEELLVQFDCSEAEIRSTLASLMRPRFRKEKYAFKRRDIYDARAWAGFPLSWFVDCKTDAREVPELQVSINLPLHLNRSDFVIKHRVKDGQRHAEMFCYFDGLATQYFRDGRWVAERKFDLTTTRDQMITALFDDVQAKAKQYQFTIQPLGECVDYNTLLRAKRKAKEAATIAKWRAGDSDIRLPNDAGNLLRSKNGYVETSRGHRINREDARAICMMAHELFSNEFKRSEQGHTLQVGGYVAHFDHFEKIKVGCQEFAWKEVKSFAQSQEWITKTTAVTA